jgi:hypothetical protein
VFIKLCSARSSQGIRRRILSNGGLTHFTTHLLSKQYTKFILYNENGSVCEASYKVSYHTACCSEAHTIAKSPIIPCVEEIVSCVFGDNHLHVIKNVLLLNSTVSLRNMGMSCFTECELIKWIKSSQGFVMRVDESTDITGLSCLHL